MIVLFVCIQAQCIGPPIHPSSLQQLTKLNHWHPLDKATLWTQLERRSANGRPRESTYNLDAPRKLSKLQVVVRSVRLKSHSRPHWFPDSRMTYPPSSRPWGAFVSFDVGFQQDSCAYFAFARSRSVQLLACLLG